MRARTASRLVRVVLRGLPPLVVGGPRAAPGACQRSLLRGAPCKTVQSGIRGLMGRILRDDAHRPHHLVILVRGDVAVPGKETRVRSEERRVGKECRSPRAPYREKTANL